MRVVICSYRTIADEHDLVNATKGAEQVLQIALRGREAKTEGANDCALGWAVLRVRYMDYFVVKHARQRNQQWREAESASESGGLCMNQL